MQWSNPLLSVLLCFHYLTTHVTSQFNNFRNFNSQRFARNQDQHFYTDVNRNTRSVNNFQNYNNYYIDHKNCSNFNSRNPVLCQNYQNYKNYNNYDTNRFLQPNLVPNQYSNYYGGYANQNQVQYQPVVYYSNPYEINDPLRSRIDHTQSSHSLQPESASTSHSHNNHHHPQEEHKIEHETKNHHHPHHEEKGSGWGWSKGHHHDHKEKKHKKKRKPGALGKIIKKFKPKEKEKLIWKEVAECEGFENFIKDVEIISLKLGWIGFKKATLALLLHILNQLYGFYSVVKVGLPERITTFIDLIAPGTTPQQIRTILAILGVLDYIIIFFFSYPIGNLIVAIDFVAEILTILSLALATFTIFDDIIEEKVHAVFGIDLREVFQGYGCNNPFSKEKKIEEFFEIFNEW